MHELGQLQASPDVRHEPESAPDILRVQRVEVTRWSGLTSLQGSRPKGAAESDSVLCVNHTVPTRLWRPNASKQPEVPAGQ
jgi:hypothetical protein